MRWSAVAVPVLVCCLLWPASASVDWGPVIDKAARYWVALDEAKKLAQQAKSRQDPRHYLLPGRIRLHASKDCVYWTGKYGRARWETSGEVIYGTYSALSSIYAALLSGEVNVKRWPEPYRSRMATAVTTALAKLLSLQQPDGGWGWKVVLTEGKVRFPGGRGHVLRTAQILSEVLIPALRLNIRTVSLGPSRYDVAKCTQAAVRFLLDQQLEDGGFSANRSWSKTPDPLYTGWALRALCEAYLYRDLIGLSDRTVEQLKEAIRRAVEWLERHQETSGEHAGLWKMTAAAIMGSEYAPPSEAQIVMGLLYAYVVADEVGLDKRRLADCINRALKAIVDWAAKYSDASVVQVDGKKAVGWAYTSTRLKGRGPYVVHTALVLTSLALANRLGLGQEAISELHRLGATLETEQEWLYRECVQYDDLAAFPYPNREHFMSVTASSQRAAILCAVAFSHPEVFLERLTRNVWDYVPRPKKRGIVPVLPVLTVAGLALARLRRR